jgi:adenylate cyclase
VFTAGRILLAHRRGLHRAFVALSVVVDIAVLMIAIWSFHLHYRAPPALYLKAPTLMYAFIFIALRTLRFEPGYVLLAGGCAALGWLRLLPYAVWGPDFAGFTHSYVAYATSYKILRSAEKAPPATCRVSSPPRSRSRSGEPTKMPRACDARDARQRS